MVSLKRFVWLS